MQKRLPPAQWRVRANEAMQLYQDNWTQKQIADKFGVSQPTVHYWLHKLEGGTLQEKTAQKIRDELVCCNIFQRLTDLSEAGDNGEWKRLRWSTEYHDICYYGEWAARIAEGMKD